MLILKEIFTNKKGRISEMISNEVGIKSETAREILNFSALLVVSYLKNNIQLLDSLKLLLEDQKRDILNSIPSRNQNYPWISHVTKQLKKKTNPSEDLFLPFSDITFSSF